MIEAKVTMLGKATLVVAFYLALVVGTGRGQTMNYNCKVANDNCATNADCCSNICEGVCKLMGGGGYDTTTHYVSGSSGQGPYGSNPYEICYQQYNTDDCDATAEGCRWNAQMNHCEMPLQAKTGFRCEPGMMECESAEDVCTMGDEGENVCKKATIRKGNGEECEPADDDCNSYF